MADQENLTVINAKTFIEKDCIFGFDTPYADAANRYIRLLIKELEKHNENQENNQPTSS